MPDANELNQVITETEHEDVASTLNDSIDNSTAEQSQMPQIDTDVLSAPPMPAKSKPNIGRVIGGVIGVVFLPVRAVFMAAARILLGKDRFEKLMQRYDSRDAGDNAISAMKAARREFGNELQSTIEKRLGNDTQNFNISVKEVKEKGYYGCFEVSAINKETQEKFSFFVDRHGYIVGQINRNKSIEPSIENLSKIERAIKASFVPTILAYNQRNGVQVSQKEEAKQPQEKQTTKEESLQDRLRKETQEKYPGSDIEIKEKSEKEGHVGDAEITLVEKDGTRTSLFIGDTGVITNLPHEMGLGEPEQHADGTVSNIIANESLSEKFQDFSSLYKNFVTRDGPEGERDSREQKELEHMLQSDLKEKYNADVFVTPSLHPNHIGDLQVTMIDREQKDNKISATIRNDKIIDAKMFTKDKDAPAEFCGVKSLQEVKADLAKTVAEHEQYKVLEKSMQEHYDAIRPMECEVSVKRSEQENHIGEKEITITDKMNGEKSIAYMDGKGNVTNSEREYVDKEHEFSQKKYEEIKEAGVIARTAMYQEHTKSVENINRPYNEPEKLKEQIEKSMKETTPGGDTKSIFSQQGIDFVITQPEPGVYDIQAHVQADITSGETKTFSSGIQFESPQGIDVPADVVAGVDKTIVASIENEAREVDGRYLHEIQENDFNVPVSNEFVDEEPYHEGDDVLFGEEQYQGFDDGISDINEKIDDFDRMNDADYMDDRDF